jgi:excisionase family DNA binding protein
MPRPVPKRRLITLQEAADYFQVTTRTVRNKISEGVITGYHVAGLRAVRVDLNEIEHLLEIVPTVVGRPASLRRNDSRAQIDPDARVIVDSTNTRDSASSRPTDELDASGKRAGATSRTRKRASTR